MSVYAGITPSMDKENYTRRVLNEFEEISSLQYQDISSRLPENRVSIGFFCPYVPEELLHAAGALPFRLMGSPVTLSHSPAHLPPGCCHFVKSSLESFLRGELDFLKGFVFSQTCDALQGLSDIWAFQKRASFLFNLMIPTHLNSETAGPFLKAEMERFRKFLETHLGKVSQRNLSEAVRLFNRIREKIGEIYELRRTTPGRISEAQFAHIIRAGYRMDRSRYLELLKELTNTLPLGREKESLPVPLYLAGNMVHSPPCFSLIEEAGARVVSDNLCSGSRFLRLMAREDIDPIDALAERYFSSFMCPTKHQGARAPIDFLIKEAEDSGAKGAVFLFYKYCEPHYFDYPDLKKALEAKGIPSLLLEVDDPATSREQMKIRIQAFVEMLTV